MPQFSWWFESLGKTRLACEKCMAEIEEKNEIREFLKDFKLCKTKGKIVTLSLDF